MTEVYDLSEEEGCFSPLPLAGAHKNALRLAVLSTIREVPGGSKAVLSTYSEKKTEWDVPPLYAGSYRGIGLQIGCEKVSVPKGAPIAADYRELVDAFRCEGWSNRFRTRLRRRVGDVADHHLLFTRSSTDVGRFVAEYVIALSRQFNKSLYVSDGTLALHVPGINDTLDLIGIVEGDILGFNLKVNPSDLYDWILAPRGTVITEHYGVYDRILRWAEENFAVVEDIDHLRLALSLLKLSSVGPNEEETAFEHRVRYTRSAKEGAGNGESPLTYERFVEVRALWVEGSKCQEDKLQDVFTALVPSVYDSEKFKKLFGVLPRLDHELTKKELARIDKGVGLFSTDYLQMKRKSDG